MSTNTGDVQRDNRSSDEYMIRRRAEEIRWTDWIPKELNSKCAESSCTSSGNNCTLKTIPAEGKLNCPSVRLRPWPVKILFVHRVRHKSIPSALIAIVCGRLLPAFPVPGQFPGRSKLISRIDRTKSDFSFFFCSGTDRDVTRMRWSIRSSVFIPVK